MPLNLTQEFTFETDSLDSFAVLLKAVIPVIFEQSCLIEAASRLADTWPSKAAAEVLSLYRVAECPASVGTCGEFRRRKEAGIWSFHWPICILVGATIGQGGLTHAVATEATLQHLQGADLKEFERRCTPRGPFDHAEGSVVHGFRMH